MQSRMYFTDDIDKVMTGAISTFDNIGNKTYSAELVKNYLIFLARAIKRQRTVTFELGKGKRSDNK